MRYSKYRAVPTVVDGIRFASKKEARRYRELKLLEKTKQISNLRLQVKYPIMINWHLITTYIADFVYTDRDDEDIEVVEDCKGIKTPVYRLKKKLMKACLGLDILET